MLWGNKVRRLFIVMGVVAALASGFGPVSVQPSYATKCFYSKHLNTLKVGMNVKQVNLRLGTSGVRKSKSGPFQTITYSACGPRYDLMFVSGKLVSIAGPY